MRRSLILALSLFAAVPALAQSKQAPPAKADTITSTATRGRQSWTSDRVTFGLGDVVTVLIDERTLASANLTENHADKRTKNMGLDIAPPGSGAVPSAPITGSVNLNNDGDSRRSGEAVRQNTFTSEMSARVIAVSANGALQIRGTKMVTVDKSKQQVQITGWIRAQDVAASTNTVPSYRLADAEITYVQQGSLGKPKAGILGKLLSALWP